MLQKDESLQRFTMQGGLFIFHMLTLKSLPWRALFIFTKSGRCRLLFFGMTGPYKME